MCFSAPLFNATFVTPRRTLAARIEKEMRQIRAELKFKHFGRNRNSSILIKEVCCHRHRRDCGRFCRHGENRTSSCRACGEITTIAKSVTPFPSTRLGRSLTAWPGMACRQHNSIIASLEPASQRRCQPVSFFSCNLCDSRLL